jgi:nicotinic acid mononucleotide adenylyltransferase
MIQLLDDAKTKICIERLKDVDGFHPATSNISSTEVRRRLEFLGPMSIVGLTPLPVIDYIISNHLYSQNISDT